MQKEMNSSLQLTIAKLELKQLEVIDKLSKCNKDYYIIRCISNPLSNEFIAVNGDWETVVGIKESECVGKAIFNFVPPYELEGIINRQMARLQSATFKVTEQFDSFVCDIINKDGAVISVEWMAKYFPEINATISIGKIKK